MKKTSEPVVFFGSGPVAAASLSRLSTEFIVEAVITKPRPLHHRGPVPVLATAEKLGLPVLTASDSHSLDALISSRPWKSRVGVLVDFGIIVSQEVIERFPLGIVNSHFSLLPEWRGADPITFSVLSGQDTTGVSLMLLVAAMDEGPILAQAPWTIRQDTTTPELTAQLIEVSQAALSTVLPLYLAGKLQPQPQDTESKKPSYSRRLTKADGDIDWQKPAVVIEREVRAFAGWPKSHTQLGRMDITVTRAHVVVGQGQPGRAAIIGKELMIYCGKDALAIEKLRPAGKPEMTSEAFVAGYRQRIV